jgi:tRNA(Ile)-lysidine synthase
LVDRQAAGEAARLVGQRPGTLSVRGLRGLDAPLCRAVLRSWIVSWGFAVPDTRHVARIMGEILPARSDASPLVAWAGCEVRRYRDDLFALAPLPPVPVGVELLWLVTALDLPPGLGRLHLRDLTGRVLTPEDLGCGSLRVRFGVMGLRCRPSGSAHQRPLKHLYQELGVPPWLRGHIPLLFAGDSLAAVGDLWVCIRKAPPRQDVRLVWTGHPWMGLGLRIPGNPGKDGR